LLILLGLWGGLAPFIGPYLHFGYTPDKTWHYSSGRLYYSIIPAAAVLLGGLIAVLSRNRGLGVFGGLIATLGGIWFSLGQTFVTVVLKKSFPVGHPILHAGATATGLRATLETLTFFGGLGVLVVLVGAVAMGRFSLLAATDIDTDTVYSEYQTGQVSAVG
jgi:hypothetical protein